MHIKTLGTLLSVFCASLALFGCASPKSQVTPAGNNTYRIVRQAESGFTRDAAKLEAEARAEAEKFCADRGKKLKIVSVNSVRPMYATGYAKAEIVFKALDAGDPELAMAAPAPLAPTMGTTSSSSPAYVVPPAPAPATPTDELVAELTKLDELRKKGILTEEEFQAEKKKILSRSK